MQKGKKKGHKNGEGQEGRGGGGKGNKKRGERKEKWTCLKAVVQKWPELTYAIKTIPLINTQ